ncbi:glycosyltransferase family 4 protein [Vibrio cholerae]|uniref:glycosyltransferase family 4 protein n=2 Tax=Vibrio cholerae TaxID=666 RepID=UPI000BA8F3D4|nr:glycosyltransferase family 4 protein [Vibrio cholerae]EGR0190253.1 glycosyltransferase family 4 protein [Vibrio cholerae]EGR1402278.1 glycosyltransferase [Vibrio cholerae]EGR1428789.1 glycosyltransferase [Vibrio cholerae]PAR78305.1 glycosyl transferase family 1 [Vibrio cholerae]QEO42449.1 glycosyltransferase family 4 protein [Vibrio cholerae]
MRVLFVTRPTVFSGPGGDTVQLLKTKTYLERLGVEIDIATSSEPIVDGYDIIHFFNLRNPQDILSTVRLAKLKGIPSVLSTIWGSYNECDRKTRKGFQGWIANNVSEYFLEYLKTAARIVFNKNFHKGMLSYLIKGHYNSQREIAHSVNVLLPNSPTELERVVSDMKLKNYKGLWVANAVDVGVFNMDKDSTGKYKHLDGCLLSAARVEIRKCQLDLIKAVKGLPYTLVIVGKPSPNSQDYYDECLKEAGDNVIFINHVEQDELAELYKVAKAHALISWMETPGLSSLEAAMMECNLLVTNRGDTEFYFEDYAEYCEPGDIESIRKGVIAVMEKEFDSGLKEKIISNFTWQHTAQQTLEGYRLALDVMKGIK